MKALAGICRLKSTVLWTPIAMMPIDHAESDTAHERIVPACLREHRAGQRSRQKCANAAVDYAPARDSIAERS